jgi:TonB-linked SusC/RagA family outer membrane protein
MKQNFHRHKWPAQNRRFVLRESAFLLMAFLSLGLKASSVSSNRIQMKVEQSKNFKVTGQVTDHSKEPLIGVTVTAIGSDVPVRAITDMDGIFSIEVPQGTTALEFAYVGFQKKQVKVSGAKSINVVMEEETRDIDEVVVTGYSTQKKASIVGAIQTVDPEELRFGSTRTLSNNLAGKLSGIIGVQRSGEPGYDDSNFWIRGISTFSGNRSPLILIDGVERDLNNVDIAEIESFSVLKDASASAMYGVRGANGVIVITTKHGKLGPPSIKFHVEHSINEPTKLPEFLDAPSYMELLNNLAEQDGAVKPFTTQQIERTRNGYDPDLYPDVDWIDAITKDYAYSSRANLDISGGSDFLRYSIVASYFKETGILEQDKSLPVDNATNNQQFNLRSNLDMDLTKTTLLRVNIGGYLNRFKKQRCNTDEAFSRAFQTLPFVFPTRYSDGTIPKQAQGVNPWALVTQQGYDFITSSKIQTLFSVEQDLKMLTPGLKIKGLFSFDRWNRSKRGRTANPGTVYPATGRDAEGNLIHTQGTVGDESMGSYKDSEYGNTRVYFEADLIYKRRFGKHDIDALFLYNQQAYDDGDIQDYRKQGIAGRLSYTYDNRYVGEFNFGYNGSENFAKGERFGFFPSVAVGWLMSEEPWMDRFRKVFSKIKFRASVGKAGDDNIGGRRFAYLTTLNTDAQGYTWGTTGQKSYSGITEGEIGVSNLTWETVTKYNFGIELGLFNALELNFDIFREKRSNIFMKRTIIPTQSGFINAPWANLGRVTNGGVEMSLDFHKQWNKDWFTSAYANFTYASNRVDEYDEPEVKKGTYRAQTGRSLNELIGLTAERLFTPDDFNADGTLKFGIPKQDGVGGSELKPGDIKYVDMNGDGSITEEDVGFIGGTQDPKVVYGFGGVVSWKNVDFNFFFQGVANTYRIIGGSAYFIPGSGTTVEGNAYAKNINDRWTDENQDPYAFWPRFTYGPSLNNRRASTWWKKDMSFLRCKTLEVGYTFNPNWLKGLYVKQLRIYASANNLFCLSSFKLWDPELGTNDGLRYPMSRSFQFGMDINF